MFSHGFPMVFLWFSCGFPMDLADETPIDAGEITRGTFVDPLSAGSGGQGLGDRPGVQLHRREGPGVGRFPDRANPWENP